jgi:hypothetical protein
MSAAQPVEGLRVRVVLVGEHSCLFSPLVLLEKIGCKCHFAEFNQELRNLLRHTKLDIVLTLNTHHRLFEIMMSLFAGLPINMFYLLPVEEGGWWLPVLRVGQDCLGAHAVRTKDFSKVLTVMVRDVPIARSMASKRSTANEYGDRKRPPIVVLKAVSVLKISSRPQRSEPIVEARST